MNVMLPRVRYTANFILGVCYSLAFCMVEQVCVRGSKSMRKVCTDWQAECSWGR
ncbi:hypothetical protein BDZ91DRAFT_736005 [Kalaharituber pfeilii]|nr:hypothetical protein BDZ91DRAFT_736005 [Kalaharituber pfeilii]